MRAHEEMYRRIVESVAQGIWIVDPQGRTVFCNERMAEILGTDIESMPGRSCFECVFPADLAEAQRQFGRNMAGDCQPFDFRLRRTDGSALWASISCRPMHDDAGVAIGLLGLFTDISERRRAEAALRASEERFRATFSQAAVGIAQTSPDGKWLLLNNRFCEILGYSEAELRGKTFLDITHPDDREPSLTAVRQLLAGEISSWSTEKRYIRKDGSTIWARLFMSLVRDQDNLPHYFIAVVEDITEKIQAERALRETEQRLALAQSAAHLGVWHRELGTHIVTIGGEYTHLYGLAPDRTSITHEEWLSLIHPDDRERVQALIRETRERTNIFDAEFRVLWPDGSIHWLVARGALFLDESGRPIYATGVNMDITERKQAEATLRESEERLKSAQRLAHVGNWEWNIKTNRVFWSEEIYRIFGRSEDYTPNYAEFLQAVQPGDRGRVAQRDRDVLAGKSPKFLEFQIIRPDGDVRWVASVSEVLRDDAGLPVRMFGVCQDVTDQKRAEAELRRNLNEIAHLSRVAAMGQLTASLAHELNQPLAAILSNAQAANRLLSSESPDLAEVRGCLTDIMADNKRAGEVINRLRGMLKKGEPEASLVNLNEVVSDAIELVRNDAMLRQASVIFEPLPALPPVLGDRVQLCQVVLNLIVNGLEAAAEQPLGGRWILVRTAEADGGVELTVEDSGKGIAESYLVRVFEPFFTTKPAGLGMGLSISRSIVQAHGGRLWVENSAAGGAIFRCLLPAAQQATAASAK